MNDKPSNNAALARGIPSYSTQQLCSGDPLSNLIHKLCHEIDNPLTAIISIAAVIQRADFQADSTAHEKLKSYAAAISKEAWRVSGLAEKLLLITSTRKDLSSPCDAARVLRSVLAKLLDAEEFCDIDVSLNIPDDAVIIEMSQEHLTVLFRELVLNSFAAQSKLTGNQHSFPAVHISLQCTTDRLMFCIRNALINQIPIPLDTCFEPFVCHPRDAHSLGLGLTVVWGIVERQGGTIQLEQTIDGNSCAFIVKVELPRLQSTQLRHPVTEPSLQAEQIQQKSHRHLSVLIIEDEELVASALGKILELSFQRTGGASCTILSGPDALEQLQRGASYDAVLCDLNLKGLSGRNIFDYVRSSRSDLKEHFAFLTGDSLSSETSVYLNSTGCPYLFKPFEPAHVIALVRELTASKTCGS